MIEPDLARVCMCGHVEVADEDPVYWCVEHEVSNEQRCEHCNSFCHRVCPECYSEDYSVPDPRFYTDEAGDDDHDEGLRLRWCVFDSEGTPQEGYEDERVASFGTRAKAQADARRRNRESDTRARVRTGDAHEPESA